MNRYFRAAALTVLFLISLLVLWLGITTAWLRGSLPRLSGEISVQGLAAPIRIVRDLDGVPHIFAQSRDDALFGLGFVHGQDRLWQMEFQRRTVQGRLSEVAGSSTLIADTYLRSLGLYRAAERSATHLSPEALRAFESYAAGVNAALPKGGRPLPPEFFMLGVRPDAWTPADSIAVLKGIALQLSANGFQEIVRLQLLKELSPEKLRGFTPPLPDDVLKAYEQYAPRNGSKYADAAKAMLAFAKVLEPIGASNNWVVGGGHTQSGKPMLANDPHLPLTIPAFWYLAHLHWPGADAIGGSVPGVPGIIAGKTRNIAWGLTTTGADVQDLYWEKLDPDNENFYMTPGGSAAFEARRETIKVRFGSSKSIRILSTRHGPVLPTDEPRLKALVPEGYVLSLSWPAVSEDDHTGETLLRILDARDASPRSVEYIFEPYTAPIQSFVYADTLGNVGLILPGKIPVRGPDNPVRGLLPSYGPSARFDWHGFLAGADRPMWTGGPQDEFVTANNKVAPQDYKPMIALDFDAEHRARRIRTLLAEEKKPFDTESFRRIQLDDGEQFAMDVLPSMLKQASASNDAARDALGLLRAWDMHMHPAQGAPLIFAAWIREFTKELVEDELGDMFKPMWSDRPNFITAVVRGEADATLLCDDVRTQAVHEDCTQVMNRSLAAAVAELTVRFGPDLRQWRWGAAHQATFSHTPFGFVLLLSNLFGFRVEIGGGNSTVQRAAYRYANADPFAAVHGSGYRGIYDLGAEEKSLFMVSTGQSGNVYSPFYANLAPRWARGEYLPMRTNEAQINAAAAGTLELRPTP
ncbi:MAG: penicillin acylase family protein [Micropepsaceae bacterium]